MRRAAVVGAGLFGCVAALRLAREGWDVSLFDRHQDILQGASAVNQGRLHRGYHYPRSPETIELTRRAAERFEHRFPSSIVKRNAHWYAIADDSKVGDTAYRAVCEYHDLPLNENEQPPFEIRNVQMVAQVHEHLIDLRRLRYQLYTELEHTPIEQHLGSYVHLGDIDDAFELLVDASYGQWRCSRKLQYEACEIAVITAPPEFHGQSLVVLDGDFFSLDPLPGTVNHLLYHVQHSVVAREFSTRPSSDLRNASYRSWGILDAATRMLPGLADARWERSWRTVRTVLPDVEETDARPTLVEREGNIISILSGKLDTAVLAADEVACLASQ